MNKLLEKAYDAEAFRKNGHLIVDMLADYLSSTGADSTLRVLPWREPKDMERKWKTDFSAPPGTETALEQLCSDIIDHSIHLHHPKNMGHQVVPPVPMAALMELVSSLLNNSMAIYEVGPFSSTIEKIVTDWLGIRLGMDEKSGGVLTSGGSAGNLTGLLAARQNKAGYDIWEHGGRDRSPLAVMVSADAHYSVARAVKIMGWGDGGIIKVPVNERRELDARALENSYRQALSQGKQVIAVAANAGSTCTGSYDPLDGIAGFCQANGLWLHVDAAHGGGAALTAKYKHLVRGLEKADSVVIDFHKMLLCPALTTAVIFKNGENAYETFSQKASYLLSDEKRGNWYDIAVRTLECTKKMMGIKIYALLKIYGVELFEEYITQTYDRAREFGEIIEAAGDFELAVKPASNIVCFRYTPASADPAALDRINTDGRERLKEDGEFYIVRTVIDDRVYLRTTLMSPFTSTNDLSRLLEKIRGHF
jgi:L-2,4-diaminobutyrate decarboxylase